MKKPTQNESIAMLTTSAGQALEYSRQALAVLDMWIDTLAPDDEMESFRVAAVHRLVSQALESLVKVRETMTAIYNLVRCSDGKTVFSFPAGGRYLVDTSNGLQSMRPLMDDEIIFTVESAARFLKNIGYQVIPPAA